MDLGALANRLEAMLNLTDLRAEHRELLGLCVDSFRQGQAFVMSIPLIIEERTNLIALQTATRCAGLINDVAKDYEDGILPIATPQKALREVADAMVGANRDIVLEKVGMKPKRKKSKLIGVG